MKKLANFQKDLRVGSVIELWDEKAKQPMVVSVLTIYRGYFAVRNHSHSCAMLIHFKDLKDHWEQIDLYKSPLGQALL